MLAHPYQQRMIALYRPCFIGRPNGPCFVKRHHTITDGRQREHDARGNEQSIKRIGGFDVWPHANTFEIGHLIIPERARSTKAESRHTMKDSFSACDPHWEFLR